jgi:hypothetical protein
MAKEVSRLLDYLKHINKIGRKVEQKGFENSTKKQISSDKDKAKTPDSNKAV